MVQPTIRAMRIALAQLDCLIGDLDGIGAAIRSRAAEAAAADADLLVLPELATCGYPPRDLLDRRRFVAGQWQLLQDLAGDLPLPTCCGAVEPIDDGVGPALANVLVVLADGGIQHVYRKQLLPTYDVFDERRYFRRGIEPGIIELAGQRIGLTVCEDIWSAEELGLGYDCDPLAPLAGCDLLVNIAASPFHLGKTGQRRQLLQKVARRLQVPVAYVNQVGGHDELLFDGGSALYGADGACLAQAERWQPGLVIAATTAAAVPVDEPEHFADLHAALVCGIRDYCRKTHQSKVVLGLSGGIDSALVAALAVDALGADAVTGLLMPGPYSSDGSVTDAEDLVANLGITAHTCSIVDANEAVLQALAQPFAGLDPNVAEENIQARLRGTLVMALANKLGAMALTTGNKSELAVGYCTIYGDMNGGLAPIGDVYKTAVFELCRWLNRDGERIPVATIEKPPSAELRPDQKDTDSLPPYEVLDDLLHRYLEKDQGPAELIEAGFDADTVARIVRLVEVNEYKRRQAAPTLRVTSKAFGVGRRIPLARALDRMP